MWKLPDRFGFQLGAPDMRGGGGVSDRMIENVSVAQPGWRRLERDL
ncbi:hypothetical protein [Roseovarius spongiae]|nr:hypothetical protein [Roseovarius spongiae]